MQLHTLAKMFVAKVIRSGQNLNLASPKVFDLLWLYFLLWSVTSRSAKIK